ncbi:MAG: GAF domain-containing protein [Thermoflexales bacterium]|nr:GAF domain-containing protein [Thermoflexales bacterium]
MERFSFRRFLNTLGGRLAVLAFFLVVVTIIGGTVVGVQLLRIRNAVAVMGEATTYLETALSVAHQTTSLVLVVQEDVMGGVTREQLRRDVSPALTTLEMYQRVLLEQAQSLPPESELRKSMSLSASTIVNVTRVTHQILQATEEGYQDWTRYLLNTLGVNHRLLEQELGRMVTLARERHSQAVAEARLAAGRLLIVVPLVTIAVILTAAGAAVLILRGVVTGIRLLSDSAGRLAAGHLEERIPVQGLEEFRFLARTFNNMASELQGLYAGLERLVAQRTAELARRTAQLEAAAHVARKAAEIRDLDTLLNETVRLISDRFGFYHAGIFLVDEAGEYAVLRAASSEGGQRMLARGHRLAVGRVGIVGYVAGTGKPRIALDVGADAVFFDNPDLPLTRSEMAVPLKVGDRVIGVLDVQSVEPEAFTEEDVSVLQTMADQIALAIENARLLEESRRALEELERLYGERAREAWRTVASSRPAAYRYTGADVEPLPAPVPLAGEEDGRRLTVPIRLWGQAIGSILLQRREEQPPWSPEEQRLAEEIGEQIALALENARLLAETEERAARERMLAEMTARLTRSLDLDALLDTAVRELARLPEVAEVALYVGGADEMASPSRRRGRRTG